MAKDSNLLVGFRLPPGSQVVKLTVRPNGDIALIDKDGNEVKPERIERSIGYARPKGPKIQARHTTPQRVVTVGGLAELAEFDGIFAIDTNSREVSGDLVSSTCFIRFQLVREDDGFRIEFEQRVNYYELRNVKDKPELLGILKVANDVMRTAPPDAIPKIAFVTDTELSGHDSINSGKTPIYGAHNLPANAHLVYASADTGSEVLNKLIRICDRQAGNYLSELGRGEIPEAPFKVLAEDPSVRYRHIYRDDVELGSTGLLKGLQLQPGSRLTLYRQKIPRMERIGRSLRRLVARWR